jgi:glyoxalase family protein
MIFLKPPRTDLIFCLAPIEKEISMPEIIGLHHVTAIAADPQRNIDFYAGFLGLRLVKLTVNFDDPGAYHLYYGDGAGHPGTLITFFSWPDAPRGRQGNGQVAITGFTIPQDALGFWIDRLIEHHIPHENPTRRFDETFIAFKDPDGLMIELVAHPRSMEREGWQQGPIPAPQAIRGLHNVTIWQENSDKTSDLLTKTMGFKILERDNTVARYTATDGSPGTLVDVRANPGFWRGSVAVGTVHHVAYRTPDDEQQQSWHGILTDLDYQVSPIMDRQYFHSIYYREPGGVLFEIATDPPGFATDEPVNKLGTHLKLPPWLESERSTIQAILPPIRLPGAGDADAL